MHKEFDLELDRNAYGVFVDKGKNNKPFFRKFVCSDFIYDFLGKTPSKVKIGIDDVSVQGAKEFKVSRTGYYRWYYHDGDGLWSGMYPIAEEIAARFFPDLSMKSDDTGSLWINIH